MAGQQAIWRRGVAALLGVAVLTAAPLASARPRESTGKAAPSIAAPAPSLNGGRGVEARSMADRIDRRDGKKAGPGVMRFGDTELRIGGRASVGYGVSGR